MKPTFMPLGKRAALSPQTAKVKKGSQLSCLRRMPMATCISATALPLPLKIRSPDTTVYVIANPGLSPVPTMPALKLGLFTNAPLKRKVTPALNTPGRSYTLAFGTS